ncbi:glycosyl transferase group 1 [Candidatus Moduliflexus flocculans]|uniref:Glycosyl transferase group 1 n=1 Tax=Candidatus Moduliflexus flocculans TaxID=1499966 RepID=A0A0S6VT28_9BACT|nr:glycosyl transferase group 1 [Candidatus Moduliflexus flocculans]
MYNKNTHSVHVMSKPRVIQIVSRYVPIIGRAGHFTYLLALMRALHQHGYQLELDVLDPWFLPEQVPGYITQIAQVVIMPASLIQSSNHVGHRSFKARFYPLYSRLPVSILAPLRKAWYRLRKCDIPGHHRPDAIATDAEIVFVRERFENICPDIFMANETFLGNILHAYKHNSTVLKVNIAFDLHHQRQKKFSESGVSKKTPDWNRQKEIALLNAANILISIHEDDTVTLREMLPRAETICVPFPTNFYPHPQVEQVPGRCLFVGSSIDHNVHGLAWFLREIWPLVLVKEPQATLHICGTVCGSLMQFASPNIQLLGRVDDLHAEYGAAQICVIPLIAGSGLKIKLVEALSHGRACVSTSVGVQGVRELENRAVLVADTPVEFATAVTRLLQQADERHVMEAQARQYVTERLTPEQAYRPLLTRFQQFYADRERQTLSTGQQNS